MPPSRRDLLAAGLLGGAAPAVAGPAGPLDVRADFPITSGGRTFLNAAYIAPIPRVVADAVRDFAEAKATRQLEVGELLRRNETVRGQFARLVGATADEVGLLFSTAEGENVLANGLDLVAGDNVVIDDLHYDTEFVLYRELERTKGIELRVARSRNGAAGVAEFEPLVDRRTRLVSVAWVSHRNGFRHDMRALADLAHAHGALIYADAIQAVGTLTVDVRAADVDALCAGSYKWMLAGWGVAPFYVKHEVLDRIRLDRFGEMHVRRARSDGGFDLETTARRFDYSSRAFGEVHALGAALSYLEQVGVARIEAHTVALGLRLQAGLIDQGHRLATPIGNRSPIVAVELNRSVADVRAVFEAARLDVTARGGRIRISPALFNTEADVDRCLEVMKGFSR